MKMKVVITRLKDSIMNSPFVSSMSKTFYIFFLMHFCFQVFVNLQSVFINTLLMRLSGDSTIVMKYNMACYIVSAVMMSFAVVFVKRLCVTTVTKMGIAFYVVMYIAFFVFMQELDKYMLLIAFLNSTAGAFYWITYSLLLTEYSSDDNRDIAVSVLGIGGGIASLVMAYISGAVISRFSDITGYYIMFVFSLIVGLIAIFISTRLPKVRLEGAKSNFRKALKDVIKDKMWHFSYANTYFMGIREGTFGFLFNLLLFEIVKSEFWVGVNTFLVGTMSMLSLFIAGKVLRPHNRIKSIVFSSTALLLCICMLFVQMSPLTIILLSVINSFCSTFIGNPSSNIFFLALQKSPHGREFKSEYISIKEYALTAGRVTGVIVTLLMPESTIGYVVAMLVLVLMQYPMAWFGAKTMKYAKAYDAVA